MGFTLTSVFSEMTPIGRAGMTDDEIAEFLLDERQNQDYTTLAGILIGIGFLLILISFGARRKKKGGAKKLKRNLKLSKILYLIKKCITLNWNSPNLFNHFC